MMIDLIEEQLRGGEGQFGDMSFAEVERALQSQGFSMENFLNLPI